MKGFVLGLLIGALLAAGGLYYYFVSGMAPAAAADPPLPFERRIAGRALDARIEKAAVPAPPIQPSEDNYVAAAKVYNERCAVCHGLPDQTPPVIADNMYPHATLMFKGKGVTDDPPQVSYWKVVNGIRLTGMPSFKGVLKDTEMWQLALLVANADKIPDSARKLLVPAPAPTPAAQPPTPASPRAGASKSKK
jgi:mono/diheme cytochrome c family protein